MLKWGAAAEGVQNGADIPQTNGQAPNGFCKGFLTYHILKYRILHFLKCTL